MTGQNGSAQPQTPLAVVISQSAWARSGVEHVGQGIILVHALFAVTGGPFWGQERLPSHSMDTCLQGRLRVSRLKQGKNSKKSLLLLLNGNKNIPDLVLFCRVNHRTLGFTDPEKAGEMNTFKNTPSPCQG